MRDKSFESFTVFRTSYFVRASDHESTALAHFQGRTTVTFSELVLPRSILALTPWRVSRHLQKDRIPWSHATAINSDNLVS